VSLHPGRLTEFDVLRSISILLLLVHHSGFYGLELNGYSPGALSPYLEAGLLGWFFLISGYFTERSLQKSQGDLLDFFRSKFIKIYPPYLAAFALYIFILGVSLKKKFDVFVYLMGAQFIFSPSRAKPILTLWYVGAIVVYYLIFAILWKGSSSTKRLMYSSLAVFGAACLIHQFTTLIDERFYKYYFVFLSGMLLARPGWFGEQLSAEYIRWKIGVAILGMSVFSFALYARVEQFSLLYIFAAYVLIVPAFVLVYAFVVKYDIFFPVRLTSFISYSSFFVYLFHRPFWRILENLLPVPGVEYQILFRMIPASLAVIVLCYYLRLTYDLLLGAFIKQTRHTISKV